VVVFFAEALLTEDLLVAGFFSAGFLLAGLLAAVFLAAGFFAAAFLSGVDFRAGAFFAAGLFAAVFLAAGLRAAVFLFAVVCPFASRYSSIKSRDRGPRSGTFLRFFRAHARTAAESTVFDAREMGFLFRSHWFSISVRG